VDTFGIISLSENSEQEYFTEIAKRANANGITCCHFIPSNINPISNIVKGNVFDPITNQWRNDEFLIPNVLYDRCFYGEDVHSKQCKPIVSWLKGRDDIFFLGYGLPNKYELYNVLIHSPLQPYLPSTKLINDFEIVREDLSAYQNIVLKPINGSQGNGIYFILQTGNSITVKTYTRKKHIHKVFSNPKNFEFWMNSLLSKKDYLIQPYLELTNHQYEPFDIRILLQKDSNGNWVERGRGIRTGHPDGIISNISAGGHISPFDSWIEQLPLSQQEYITQEINDILTTIPFCLEESFLPLFELGIDIGVAKNGSLWILDINSKPGRKVILETNREVKDKLYEAPILYSRTLTSLKAFERKRYDAKTLSH
jgi:glutathione synthase/RimK-type ligase-like ATP-grasp enzyme